MYSTPWKKISERYGYHGWRKILIKAFELPSGKIAEFDVMDSSSYVTIIPITISGQWVCVRQFRPGPELFLTGFPEGGVEKGEEVEATAQRELLEETGYLARRVVLLKSRLSAYTTQTQYFVLALDCEKAGRQELDESEFIEVMEFSTDAILERLRSREDEFNNIDAAYMAFDYLQNGRPHSR